MPNANIELAQPRKKLFLYLKATPLHVFLRFVPWLVDKTFAFQPTERILEYPFIHENMSFNRGGERILDVGSGSSLLPLELASKGYQVWSIDLKRGYYHSINHNNFTCVQEDIRKTNFPDSFFDIVTALSSIEHTGLVGKKTCREGDQDAVQEILRILKAGGRFLLTVPFGRRSGVYTVGRHDSFRVYDYTHLKELLDRFEIESKQFAVLEKGSWRPSSLEEAEAIDSLSQRRWYSSKTVAMIVARKPFIMGEVPNDSGL